MTPYQIIADAVKRAKLRRIYKDCPTPSKCIKCDKPTTTNRFGKPICVCQTHYKEARQMKLCSNCYSRPKYGDQCYCIECKLHKDNQRPKRKRAKKWT